ncbi:MAG: glycosyltransferase family 4 protein [Phycisphaeraceae bacterium]|nr:MAG: glycosyltransferase family 4 protein [Phycisphaeraceae bacterium]
MSGGPDTDQNPIGLHPETHEPLRVVIINQYYMPDVASTGHLLHELATELAELKFSVEVLTSRPSYGPRATWVDCPMRETVDGVKIKRMWTTRFSKDNLLGRATNYITFMGQLFLRVLLTSRSDTVYLYTTNPPFLGVVGAMVSLVRRHAYVKLLHDAYPQLAVWVGTIRRGGIAERVWHWVNKISYGRSRHAIVLCQKAKDLVCDSYHVPANRVHVVPNWADSKALVMKRKPESEFAASHDLLDHFVGLYSGNLGLYYEFETLLDAAELLRDQPFKLVFVGAGGKRDWLADEIIKRELNNTMLLPYQPYDKLGDSLGASDASFVTIARGIEGISFPSKLYTSLAVGRPILALSEEDSELRELVEAHDIGRWSAIGDAEHLAANIRELIANPDLADRLGARARASFENSFTKRVCAGRYAEVLWAAHPLTPKDTVVDRGGIVNEVAPVPAEAGAK